MDPKGAKSANLLYQLSSEVFIHCCERGILCTVENPVRSYMWESAYFTSLGKHLSRHQAVLQHCSSRKKSTKLLSSFPQIRKLAIQCDGRNAHDKWGRIRNKWATSEEMEYPTGLCQAWSRVLIREAVPAATQINEVESFTTRQSGLKLGSSHVENGGILCPRGCFPTSALDCLVVKDSSTSR